MGSQRLVFSTAILLLVLFAISCKRQKVEDKREKVQWDHISIRTDYQSIDIFSKMDTMWSLTWGIKDSCEGPGSVAHLRVNKKNTKTYVDSAFKDSIYRLIMEMITKPYYTKRSATCYVGNIDMSITTGNTTLSCSYNSVGDWPSASSQTNRLFEILRSKIYVSTQ